ALGVAKPSVASYLSQEILAKQKADRVHRLPAQPPVKFHNMVVISLSMKLKEEHCSIGFSRPLTNQNKNPFSYGSMEGKTHPTQLFLLLMSTPTQLCVFKLSKGDTLLFCNGLFSHSGVLQMKILEGNAGELTNFEVLDFLRAKGASKDPTRVIAKVAQSEYKVYDYLVDTAASVQTRESINEFLTSVK
ncbi:hypothetical protein D0Y65_048667, partial [Glycine soja]